MTVAFEHAVFIPNCIFPSFAPSPHLPTLTLSRILAYNRIIPSFTHSPHLADRVLQFSHTHSIRRSYFDWVCSISAFDGRRLAAFPLCILPCCPCPPFSCTIAFLQLLLTPSIQRSHFGRICTISAFDGRVLVAFTLSAFSHPASAPPFSHTIRFLQLSLTLSIQRLYFGRFCTISAFDGRILAAFPSSAFSQPTPAICSYI